MAEDNKKKFAENISSKILSTLVTRIIIALSTFFISSLVSLKVSDLFRLTGLERVLLVSTIAFIVLGLISIFFYTRYSKYIPHFEPALSDFNVIEKEIIHEYLEPLKIKHTRHWKLKALRDGLSNFSDKYCWTGSSLDFKATIEGHKVLDKGYNNVYSLYSYEFGRTLRKGQTIDITVEFILKGEHKYFISTPIEEFTNKVILCIIFPLDWPIRHVILDTSGVSGSKKPESEEEVDLTRGMYRWTIPKPKLFHHYQIKWNLNHNIPC